MKRDEQLEWRTISFGDVAAGTTARQVDHLTDVLETRDGRLYRTTVFVRDGGSIASLSTSLAFAPRHKKRGKPGRR